MDIALAALDIANGIAVESGAFGERLLRRSDALAKLPDAATDRRGGVTRHDTYLSTCTTGCLHNLLCNRPKIARLWPSGYPSVRASMSGMRFTGDGDRVRTIGSDDIRL